MPFDVRTITDAEVETYQCLLEAAFGTDPDPAELAIWRPLVECDRSHAAYDDGAMVGTAGILTFDLTVPGGPAPAAGVTGVSVAPTHRRQGVLSTLMRAQLDHVRDRGAEAFAALWASEAPIYGRFGYGVAARRCGIEVRASDPELLGRPPTGRVRQVGTEAFRAVAPAVYDTLRPERPGAISRSPGLWARLLADPPASRRGGTAQRLLAYESAGGDATGYAIYRMRPEFADGVPNGAVHVVEVMALDPDAHAGLWRHLLGVDLTRSATWYNAPPDDPIAARLVDARAVRRNIGDGLYVRLLDVPRALAQRRYATSGRVTIRVVDPFGGYAAGTWTLDATPDGATCVPATASPDLILSAAELGAAYLGDTTLLTLAEAGRVDEHAPGAVATASRLLAWDRAVWCPEIF